MTVVQENYSQLSGCVQSTVFETTQQWFELHDEPRQNRPREVSGMMPQTGTHSTSA